MELKQIIKRVLHLIPPLHKTYVYANVVALSSNASLKGKKIIITGGAKGIGLAMANKFIKEEANVLITGRNEETLQSVAKEIGCQYLCLDVTKPETFYDFIVEANKKLGENVNCLVNNAGVSLHENTFFDVTPEGFDLQINTNFKGCFFLTQQFISLLHKEKREGNVLFISSETGNTVDCRPYGYTKTAVNSMVQGLANLFAKEGIRINAIAPGITATNMTGFSTNENLYCSGNIIERVYLPEEIAEVASFLLSDVSKCISGQIITCNNANTVNPRWK